MCGTCGCGDPHIIAVPVRDKILAENDRTAQHNRAHFTEQGVHVVNMMGSPGSGKTALLESTARALGQRRRLGALAGDLATDYDARRLETAGVTARSISTGSICHLDAAMVHDALHAWPWHDLDHLFIENVGNLVCPAVYDLGQAHSVVVLSVTEGPEKPLKYPVVFRTADVVVLTKIDLLPHLRGLTIEQFEDSIGEVMPAPIIMPVSTTQGDGLELWVRWLDRQLMHSYAALLDASTSQTL
jgi:hydrogenase nickel incorporation protein HypB